MRAKLTRSRYRRKAIFFRFLSVALFFILLGGAYEALRLVQMHFEEETLQEDIDRLRQENRSMSAMREKLEGQENPAEIERRAREELGLIKEGERVYRRVTPRAEEEDEEEKLRTERLDSSKHTR